MPQTYNSHKKNNWNQVETWDRLQQCGQNTANTKIHKDSKSSTEAKK